MDQSVRFDEGDEDISYDDESSGEVIASDEEHSSPVRRPAPVPWQEEGRRNYHPQFSNLNQSVRIEGDEDISYDDDSSGEVIMSNEEHPLPARRPAPPPRQEEASRAPQQDRDSSPVSDESSLYYSAADDSRFYYSATDDSGIFRGERSQSPGRKQPGPSRQPPVPEEEEDQYRDKLHVDEHDFGLRMLMRESNIHRLVNMSSYM